MKRLPQPDLLKGFAVFMIVPVHILEFFINAPGRESLFGKILLFLGGSVCVPVFMITIGSISTAIFQTQSLSVYPFWLAGIFVTTALMTWLVEKKSVRKTGQIRDTKTVVQQ